MIRVVSNPARRSSPHSARESDSMASTKVGNITAWFRPGGSRRSVQYPTTPISTLYPGHGNVASVQCVLRRAGRRSGRRGRRSSWNSRTNGESGMEIIAGIVFGFLAWFIVRYLIAGLYTIDQNERAVITSFGRAQRLGNATTLDDPISETLVKDEKGRYAYPQVRVVQPGFYWKWPWQRVHKVSIATSTTNMAFDPDAPKANQGGTILDAVTKDQLNIGLDGQIRYRVAESNLYAYLFGVKNPIAHVMGYFVSVLRERIANFASPTTLVATAVSAEPIDLTADFGVSINDLRKNLRDLNEHMDR